MGSIGTSELLLIFLVVLLVFGAKRIPEIARNLGTALREFQSATREMKRQFDVEPARYTPPKVAPPATVHAPPPHEISVGDDPHLSPHGEGMAGEGADKGIDSGLARSAEVDPL